MGRCLRSAPSHLKHLRPYLGGRLKEGENFLNHEGLQVGSRWCWAKRVHFCRDTSVACVHLEMDLRLVCCWAKGDMWQVEGGGDRAEPCGTPLFSPRGPCELEYSGGSLVSRTAASRLLEADEMSHQEVCGAASLPLTHWLQGLQDHVFFAVICQNCLQRYLGRRH
ncbi:hypothetical protein NDU88_006330 [Pleurodeles waltl]|uniref:Uncharacterized protein n=1 Tax=Pleurodeles waltl TaxID=8319 RepID=A0AAV7L3D3_PLEWA|nr:hypothetical protein NDU88_006330 [Pleurodeles waltl]